MRITYDQGRRNVAEVLEAVGRLLDTYDARSVAVLEVDDGFIVRARVKPAADSPRAAPHIPFEQVFRDTDVASLIDRLAAVIPARRAVGPHECGLRAVGRMAAALDLRELTLIEQERGGWLMWYRRSGIGPVEEAVIGPDDIDRLGSLAGGRRAVAIPIEIPAGMRGA
jgi:hypothetical protein